MLLSVQEAADRLGVSAALIYALCAKRRIRHERHGVGRGVIRIPEEALDEYREACQVETGPLSFQPPLKHIRT